MDWAQELIKEITDRGLDDDATRAFCRAYADGDSVEANKRYSAMAEEEQIFNPNCHVLRIFPDWSCDADWKQGIDRFYPDLQPLTDEDEDVADRFRCATEEDGD